MENREGLAQDFGLQLYPPHLTIPQKKEFLQQQIETLRKLCDHINPYEDLSPQVQKQLQQFRIINLEDPFWITNQLLALLEDSIEELQRLSE